MSRYTYDFHIHSCLSPCADNSMTPASVAGTATLAGIGIMALTDHNSVKNCPAFFEACKAYGVIPVAGAELTTAEDIHVVCLFETLEGALLFGDEIDRHRVKIKNRTDIFGDQLITDIDDNVIGIDEYLLSNATDITVDAAPSLVKAFGGVCYPAHVDRHSNGIIATLGDFPKDSGFLCAEFHDKTKCEEYIARYKELSSKRLLTGSDAHYLWDIRDADDTLELSDEPYSGEKVRHELFKYLRCEI